MNLQGRNLSVDMHGDDVRLLQSELLQLGFDIPEIELHNTVFGSGTREAVLRFQDMNRLEPTGIVDERTAKAINAAVEASTYTVLGTVASPDRAGVGRLRVQLVDKNVGQDVPLFEAVTDDRGHYDARFTGQSLRERGKSQPDLQALVYMGEVFLAASDVHYNATNHETLNVTLPANAAALPSEHETLTSAIEPHYGGSLGDLEESGDRQDITYLANKTGWDARAVALAALADQFSAKTTAPSGGEGIAPPFFYALFRAGLPANESALYQTDAQTAAAIWKQGIAQGVIPAALEASVPQALERFQQLAAKHALEGPALAGVSPLKEMLLVSLGDDPARQMQFADLYTRYRSDPKQFWNEVHRTLGDVAGKRLKVDGQLGYLTLNNAPLIRKLHSTAGPNGLHDTVSLAANGYYRVDQWLPLIGDLTIPPEIPGDNAEERRARYAELLATQVRLSFPTAVVAQMVKSGETPLVNGLADQVHAFLLEHQGKFEIGMQPVEQYLAQNNLQAPPPKVTQEVKRIQRVYQITPTDDAMNTLLKHGLDSAYAVMRYDQDEFVQTFKNEIGGEANALLTYAKAQQVHNAVLNIATSYLTARTAPAIGSDANALVINPAPSPTAAANAGDVIAYPTLEGLFGEMDYCACEHCRSILSPAAYLVNLLQFLDRDSKVWASFLAQWKSDHGNAPYPFADQATFNKFQHDWNAQHPSEPLPNTEITPLQVLLERRPDIQHLQLTCENTNIPLPYIDLVNETLEYYITSEPAKPPLSLANYQGHNTDGDATPEELLANPQFVSAAAYVTLAGAQFPLPLPFHQPLENLRRYFDRFETSLPKVMEALRKDDSLERASANEYGWRDTLMEELRLSRAEYALLTDRSLTLQQLYGYAPATPEATVLAGLSNVKAFTRRVGISYEEMIEILKTRFINPNSALIPKLERLGVPFATLKELKASSKTGQEWLALLPSPLPDASQYGGNIEAWVKDDANYANIMRLITVTNPTDAEDVCSFDKLEFRYANPDNNANTLRAFEFVRLIRFIRLWKKLGWTIEQTDKAITALYPADQTPNDPNDAVNLQRLDAGCLTLLPRLSVVRRVMNALTLHLQKDLLPLLACFAPIDAHGAVSLYRQMFLSPALLKQDPVFADDGYGNFLQKVEVPYSHPQPTLEQPILDAASGKIAYDDVRKRLSYTGVLSAATRDAIKAVIAGVTATFQAAVDALYTAQRLFSHAEALRAAFLLTDAELSQITAALGFDADTLLTVENISAIFRHGWLARILRLSVREFLLFKTFTGIDPFAAPDAPHPPILRFIELVHTLRVLSLKPTEALYLIWNQDISGKSNPDDAQITDFARTLRSDLAATENEFALVDDPDGQIARARMALVYGNDASDLFFGLLGNTLASDVPYSHGQVPLVTSVPYSHGQATLEQAILDAAPGLISYNDSLKRLSFNGVLGTATRDKLKAVAGVTAQFRAAVDCLYAENEKVVKANLQQPIVNVAPGRISYDDFRKRLSFTGILTTATCNGLKAVTGVTAQFQAAVDSLYAENQKIVRPFFARYPELLPLYDAYVASNDTVVTYSHGQPSLEPAILDAASGRIAYDDVRKQLSYRGQLTAVIRDALKAVTGVTAQFQAAVDSLDAENQKIVGPFLAAHPELLKLYESLVASGESPGKKYSALIEHFLPELKRRRKRQQALQAISAAVKAEGRFASAVLDDAKVLHAVRDNTRPSLDDLTALETLGLSAQFFFRDTATGVVDLTSDAEAHLDYAATGSHKLPPNPAPASAISGIWSGYLEAPENGFYKLRIEADAGATVTLTLDSAPVAMAQNANVWSNDTPIELRAGTLYALSLKVEKVKDTLIVRWETSGRGWEVIPPRYLYAATLTNHLRAAYVRFLKALSLATPLRLTASETSYFAAHADYHIGGKGWLNSLPVVGSPDNTTSTALLKAFTALLDFARIKADLAPDDDERLLTILKDPVAATQNADSLLFTLTRWERDSVNALLARLGKVIADLARVETFRRVYDAYAMLKKMGIPASALLKATTNEPNDTTVREVQAALRARYDESDWLTILKPINDQMRVLQRDALVAYILHQLRETPATAHIDTPDKLFEYFLMDVQMEPCMQTSRIRHALSSVQLFIERCLMNLEPQVAPSSIDVKQWEWMKRYRTWEANRKVFLYPENWLEPELRDDQSPFFKETMSELLQSDITEDTAHTRP